jgi:hypothetical protein
VTCAYEVLVAERAVAAINARIERVMCIFFG